MCTCVEEEEEEEERGRETQWRGCRDQWKGRLAFLNVGRHTDTQGEREGEKLFPEEEEEEEKKIFFFYSYSMIL